MSKKGVSKKRSKTATRSREHEHVVSSWAEFLRLVNSRRYRSWAFRGQSNAAWDLWPTLPRELRNRGVLPEYWDRQEGRAIRIFQRKAFHFIPDVPPVGDTPRWLALMQHHGAPTRMLDFTWSPYVAAFFALEPATGDAAVWAVNTREIKTFGFGPHEEHEQRPVHPKDWIVQYLSGPPGVVVGEPYFMNKRLIAQSGTLLIPEDITRPVNRILGRSTGLVAKFILPAEKIRAQGMEELYRMNVTHATLFPGLDGLSRSMAYELEFHWRFNPRTGRRK